MGQYHVLVNLTKRQAIVPHQLGDGLKLHEQMYSSGGVGAALIVLLAVSNGRGGGDIHSESEVIGSWAGDALAIVGDYAEDRDIDVRLDPEPSSIYDRVTGDNTDPSLPRYRDITLDVRRVLERDGVMKYGEGEGWVERGYA